MLNIEGDVREGQWDAELQGEYYQMIFSTMFSHPAVDVINMWGMSANTWMGGSGLVGKAGKAKPAFYVLRDLIHKKWHTRKEGILPLNGKINCRAFYGDYLLQVELANGKSLNIPLKHSRDMATSLIFYIDLATARLLQ